MIRVISFNTGYNKSKSTNKRKVLENKRITYLIKNENEKFNVSELAEYVRKIGNIYFDNFNEADIVLGGDGSTWMKRLAKELNAKYILDFFHAAKYFKDIFIIKGKQFIKGNLLKYNNCIQLFKNGKHKQLLSFLIKCKIKINSKIYKYFKNNEIGISNEGIKNNIGVSAENDIAHLVKEILGFGNKLFNINILNKILTHRASTFNQTGHFKSYK